MNRASANNKKSEIPSEMELFYKNKESEDRLIPKVPTVSLKEVEKFGQNRLDGWQNMLIFGDNLPVLKKFLKETSISEQVKLIYIDPPFSTRHNYRSGTLRTSTVSWSKEDDIAYEDQLSGTEYIDFLRKRLVLLRDILAKDGAIYVHIDYKVGHYVKIIMDEVFGQENFISDIARIKCNPKNFERKGFGNIKDLILFYSKSHNYIWNEQLQQFTDEEIKRLFPRVDKDGRRYTTTPLHAPGETRNGPTGKSWKKLKPPKGRHWRYSPNELTRLDQNGLIEWSSTGNPRKKIYADEMIQKGKKLQDIWEFKDPPYPVYPTEKNLDMLKMIIQTSSQPDNIVLDCFAGSGTTLTASEELDRRWIGIDNSRIAIETAKKRLLSIKPKSKAINSFTVYEVIEESESNI